MPAARGRADSGDLEIDLTELFVDAASVATDLGVGIALYVDEMQDIPADDVSALCAACHELSQSGGPLIVVGAGLPHLPAVLSASKSYSERLFRYARIDRLDRGAADLALLAPAEREGVTFTQRRTRRAVRGRRRLSLLRPGVRQGRLGHRARDADQRRRHPGRGSRGRRRAGRRILRQPVRTRHPRRARLHAGDGLAGDEPVPTANVADELGRKPSSLSPARDGLIKKGLIYSAERGLVAFTVPHFGHFLRSQPV